MSVQANLPLKLNDVGYVMDMSQFERLPIGSYRTNSDVSGQDSERSVADEELWKRVQNNWEYGAGQDWFDRSESDRARFKASMGINPWAEGKLSLYPSNVEKAGTSNIIAMVTAGGYLYCLTDAFGSNTILRYSSPTGSSSLQSLSTSGLRDMTTDGNRVWVIGTTGTWSFTGTGVVTSYSSLAGEMIGYANGRLLASDDNSLYEIQDGGATNTLIWTHPNSSFTWRKVVSAPNGIYLFGDTYYGSGSEVYKINVSDSTGDLTPPIPAVELQGESIKDMSFYGGIFVASTTRGVRLFNIANGAGHLTYGKVIDDLGQFGGEELFISSENVYVAGPSIFTKADGTTETRAGFYHLRLTDFNDTLVPPYVFASGISGSSPQQIIVFENVILWNSGTSLYSVTGNPAVGHLDTGRVEFGVADEEVRLSSADLHFEPLPSGASIKMYVVDADGNDTLILTAATPGSTSASALISADLTSDSWNVFIEMTPNGALFPVLERWSLKGFAKPSSYVEELRIPIIIMDQVSSDENHAEYGHNVFEDFGALKTLASSREIVNLEIGDEVIRGYVQSVALLRAMAKDWTSYEDEGMQVQGTYTVIFRSLES